MFRMSKTVYVQDYYTVIEQFYNGVVEPKMQLEEFITKKDEINEQLRKEIDNLKDLLSKK